MKRKPIVRKMTKTELDEYMRFREMCRRNPSYPVDENGMPKYPCAKNEAPCDDTERYVRIEFIYKGDLFKLISRIKKITKKDAVKTTFYFGSDAELDEYVRRFKKQRED